MNQIEINPFNNRKNTIQFFQAEGIVMHSYRTLRQGKEMGNEKITAIAAKHSKSSAQILGRWCVQQGTCVYVCMCVCVCVCVCVRAVCVLWLWMRVMRLWVGVRHLLRLRLRCLRHRDPRVVVGVVANLCQMGC